MVRYAQTDLLANIYDLIALFIPSVFSVFFTFYSVLYIVIEI